MFCKLSTIIAPCEVTTKSGLDQNEIVLKTVKFAPFYEVIMDNDANKRGQPQIPIANKNIPERSLRVFRRDPSRHTLKVLAQNGPNDLTTSTSSPSSGSAMVPDIDYSSSPYNELTPHVSTRDGINPYQDEGVVYHTKRVKTGSSRSSRDHFDVTYSPRLSGYGSARGSMMLEESAAAPAGGSTTITALTPPQRRLVNMETSNFGNNAGGAGAGAAAGVEKMTMNTPRSATRGSSGVGGQSTAGGSTTATMADTSYGLSTPIMLASTQQPLYHATHATQQQGPPSLYPFSLTRIEGAAPSGGGREEMWEPSQWIAAAPGSMPPSINTNTQTKTKTNTTNSGTINKPTNTMWECVGGARGLGEYSNIATELDKHNSVVVDSDDGRRSASREGTVMYETPIIMQEDPIVPQARKYTGCVGTQWCMGETSTTILIPTSPMHNSSTMVKLLGSEAKPKNGSDSHSLFPSSLYCMRPSQGCYDTTHEGQRDVSLTLALEPCPSNQFTSHMNTTSTESTTSDQHNPKEAPHDDIYKHIYDDAPSHIYDDGGSNNQTPLVTNTTTTPWVGEGLHKQFNLGVLAPHIGSFRMSTSGTCASGKTPYASEENLKHPAEEAFPQLPRVNTGLMFGLRTKNNDCLNVHKNANPILCPSMSTAGDSTSAGNNVTHPSHKQLHTAATASWVGIPGGGGGSPIWSRMNANTMGTTTPATAAAAAAAGAGAGAGNISLEKKLEPNMYMSSTSTPVSTANHTATAATAAGVVPSYSGVAHHGGGGASICTESDHVPLQTDSDSPPGSRFRSKLQIEKGDSEIDAARAVTGAWGCYKV